MNTCNACLYCRSCFLSIGTDSCRDTALAWRGKGQRCGWGLDALPLYRGIERVGSWDPASIFCSPHWAYLFQTCSGVIGPLLANLKVAIPCLKQDLWLVQHEGLLLRCSEGWGWCWKRRQSSSLPAPAFRTAPLHSVFNELAISQQVWCWARCHPSTRKQPRIEQNLDARSFGWSDSHGPAAGLDNSCSGVHVAAWVIPVRRAMSQLINRSASSLQHPNSPNSIHSPPATSEWWGQGPGWGSIPCLGHPSSTDLQEGCRCWQEDSACFPSTAPSSSPRNLLPPHKETKYHR